MRLFWLVASCSVVAALVPGSARASAFDLTEFRGQPAEDPPRPTSSKAPGSGSAGTPTAASPTSSPAPAATSPSSDDMFKPTSSRAPSSAPVESTPPPTQESPAPPPAASEQGVSLEEERGKPGNARNKPFNRHGIGVRGGIVVIPTWILSKWVDTQTNALCRGEMIGNYAESQGLLKTDGCNFYVGPQYVYRQSRVLDIVGSIGYQQFHTPEGYWLDEFNSAAAGVTGNPLTAADYTEVDLSMMYIEADFIARAPIVVRDDFEFGLGGGAGVGLGILFGGVYQTPIGSDPRGFTPGGGETIASCQEISDLADFTRCTPRWDPDEDPDGNPPADNELETPNASLYATCTKDRCSGSDLRAFGYRKKNGDVPPVIPVVNLIVSARFIVKDVVGIDITGGFNTGFYFGGALTYFFGKQFQQTRGDGNTSEGRASSGPQY